MKLISLEVKNYRTLEDVQLSFSDSYCTISGKNNAGKSSVIRLLSLLFGKRSDFPWLEDSVTLNYKEDRTQWVKDDNAVIDIKYKLELSKKDDPALISFIEKIASTTSNDPTVSLTIRYLVAESEDKTVAVMFDDVEVDKKAAKEIDKRIKDSDLLFLYNSPTRQEASYYRSGRRRLFYDFVMSKDEKRILEEASKSTEKRLKSFAKQQKEGLNTILGRLSENLDVEFSPMEKFSIGHMPIGINLRDKHVEVPLDDWGSGTQNRTQILMAILQANRIKTVVLPDDKITPVVVLEEPESFLHPSAQSEFGKILQVLAQEFGVQIIVTSHSPYMLNREEPSSNILLIREARRGQAIQTTVADTSGEQWMAPFAEQMGILPSEFNSWRPVFSSYKSKVLLVEGFLDKEYFEWLQTQNFECERLSSSIEVVSYGGKDALKNTSLVQFVLSKFDEVFVTYDLDADGEVKGALTRLGLKEGHDFIALGMAGAGRDCFEGLLPDRVLSIVNGRETDLVMQLGSRDRKQAKDALKKRYLDEFKSRGDYSKEELNYLSKAVKAINKKLGTSSKT